MLSIPHLIIIFVVALVVFGPEKLPELARNLGKMMAEFRRATGDLRNTFEGHMQDLEREAEQRRIGGPAAAPAPVLSLPTMPAAGTVPTEPPHASAAASVERVDHIEPEATQSEPIQPKPESVSDGGTRPA
ncbi:MAG TPA: twin-arginine translocase TatA/TatE family subunit [Candidatus Limnocylindria bacterium]|nr:twin-arginine translocase TatA/TatE family subunit [Candidatus Limnocylindria bacterium]